MSFKIDADALKSVLDKYAEEKLNREIRDLVVYSLPPELHEIYKAYVAEVVRKQEATERHIKYAAAILYYGAAVALMVVGFIGILK